MVNVVDVFPRIKRTLLEEFWDLTCKKISEELGSEYELEKQPDIFINYSKIYVYKTSWLTNNGDYIASGAIESLTGNVYYGVHMNSDNKALDLSSLRTTLRENEMLKGLRYDKWWAGYKYLNIDFSKNMNLKDILPGRRDSLASSIAMKVAELTRGITDDLEKSIRDIKNEIG
jgi:hypothetical protein